LGHVIGKVLEVAEPHVTVLPVNITSTHSSILIPGL
jgi:hypothetical protein